MHYSRNITKYKQFLYFIYTHEAEREDDMGHTSDSVLEMLYLLKIIQSLQTVLQIREKCLNTQVYGGGGGLSYKSSWLQIVELRKKSKYSIEIQAMC